MTCKESSIDFCSDCIITQAQNEVHHSYDHVFYGYRFSTEYHSQSDGDSDGDDAENDPNDDFSMSENIDYNSDAK